MVHFKTCFSINAGCVALPALLSIKHVMKQRNVDDIWSGKDELPVSTFYLCKKKKLLNFFV